MIVDAHLHLWDPDRLDYPWLAEVPPLLRAFGPEDLDPGGYQLTAAVFVEAGCRDPIAEVEWVEEIAGRWPTLAAAVAYAPLERGAEVASRLAVLAKHHLVRGVRRNTQDEAPGFAASEEYAAGTRLLADHGFTADLCIRHHQLPDVIRLVAAVPEVTFVLDHLGKPDIRNRLWEPWREQLSRLAGFPNVMCKLSGLTTEADPDHWTVADLTPYLRHALAEFGPERCLAGGDWPVSTLATGYARWWDTLATVLDDHPAADRAQVLGGTATRVYRLEAA